MHMASGPAGRFVAIKKVRRTLSLDPAFCQRLTAEAALLRRIDHPNVVRVLDGGINDSGQPYVVMSRVFGQPLDAVTAAGPLTRERITNITSQLLDGLAAIHKAGVVHADIKSSNVLVNELDRITIVDFGLARLQGVAPADGELFGGTPSYMAPEVLGGDAPTVASDVYAAGVVVYEMLTGTTPLPRKLSAMMMFAKIQVEAVQPPSKRAPDRDISPDLDAVLLRALAPSPLDRFPSVTAFASALATALARWGVPVDDNATSYWRRVPTSANLAQTQRRPDDNGIIEAALAGVSDLVGKHDVSTAIIILESALSRLQPADKAGEVAPQAWRLETVLAALYATANKRDHAIRLARVALQHAQRSRDPEAISRATQLLARLAQPRLARGSRITSSSSRSR